MTEPIDYGYDSYLSQVPEALRDQIKPAFEQYSEKLKGSVDEQYGQLAPLKEYIDQGYTPQHFGAGLEVLQAINNNPEQVFQGLLENYPDLAQQFLQQQQQQTPQFQQNPQQQQVPSGNEEDPYESRFSQIDQVLQLLTQGLTQQQSDYQSQQQAAQEQQELQQFQKQLDELAPEDKFHRPFILSYIAQGQSPQQAIQSYNEWQTGQTQRQNSLGAPIVAPAGGGGLPSESIDTSKLTDQQRKDLMIQYMQRANQQG